MYDVDIKNRTAVKCKSVIRVRQSFSSAPAILNHNKVVVSF